MKFHQHDWSKLAPQVRLHDSLSPSTRHHMPTVVALKAFSRAELGADLDRLIDAGLVSARKKDNRVAYTNEARPLLTLVRAADRATAAGIHTERGLAEYIRDALTGQDRGDLIAHEHERGDRAVNLLRVRVPEPEWVEYLTAPETSRRLKRFADEGDLRLPHVLTPAVQKHLKALVARVSERGGWFFAGDFEDLTPGMSASMRSRVFQAACRYLLLFVRTDPETSRIVLGLHPGIHVWQSRGEPVAPEPRTLEDVFTSATLITDLQQVLVRISSSVVRLKDNGSIYKKDADRISTELQPDEHFNSEDGHLSIADRLDRALRAGYHAGYLIIGTDATGKRCLVSTDEGKVWLGSSRQERFVKLMKKGWRPCDVTNVPARITSDEGAGSTPYAFERPTEYGRYQRNQVGIAWDVTLAVFFGRYYIHVEAPQLCEEVVLALARLPQNGLVPYRPYLDHETEIRNPLLRKKPENGREPLITERDRRYTSRRALAHVWDGLLQNAMFEVLVPLGGLQLALQNNEGGKPELFIGLTETGAYLLGLAERPPAFDDEAAGRILVQPDFGVMFMGPAPAAEARLAAFCERTGSGVGTVFKITQTSVLAAASAGLAADQILAILDEVSSVPVPDNVATEIRTWHGRQRTVAVEQVLLIRCEDEETAARVRSILKSKVELVGPTVLAVKGGTRAQTLVKHLSERGITLDTSRIPAKKKKAQRRRTYYRRRW